MTADTHVGTIRAVGTPVEVGVKHIRWGLGHTDRSKSGTRGPDSRATGVDRTIKRRAAIDR